MNKSPWTHTLFQIKTIRSTLQLATKPQGAAAGLLQIMAVVDTVGMKQASWRIMLDTDIRRQTSMGTQGGPVRAGLLGSDPIDR
jgi:hypothetical protein